MLHCFVYFTLQYVMLFNTVLSMVKLTQPAEYSCLHERVMLTKILIAKIAQKCVCFD